MKKIVVFTFSFFLFCALNAFDFVYQIQFKQADDQEKDLDELEKDQIKIIETIFRDNFNPSGFTQINPFLLKDIQASLSESDFAKDDSDFVKSRIIMNKLNITHSLLGLVNNMGNVYYVRVFFSEVSPSFRSIAVGNFDCAVSDSLAKCAREFAEKFAKDQNIVEEGKRAKQSIQHETEKEKTRLIYGFLNVFPSDIGKYKEIPTDIIKKINSSGVFKDQNCEDWRVPNEDEVALLAGERLILKAEDYITEKKGDGRLRLVADCKKSKENIENQQNNNSSKSEVIYGFLRVFPKDLGKYRRIPKEIVNKINLGNDYGVFGCKTWRIPTENELALLASRGLIVKAEDYLSCDGKNEGLLRLVADMPGYETSVPKDKNHENVNLKSEKKLQNEEAKPDLKMKHDSNAESGDSATKPSPRGCSADIL